MRRLPLPQLPLVPAGSPSLLLHGLVGVDASKPGEKLIIPGVISPSATSQNYISDGKQRKLLLESMGDFSRRADINLSMFPACNILSKSIVYSLHLWSIIRNLSSVREGVLDCSTYPAKNARSYPLQWTCRITSCTATANTKNHQHSPPCFHCSNHSGPWQVSCTNIFLSWSSRPGSRDKPSSQKKLWRFYYNCLQSFNFLISNLNFMFIFKM